MMETAYSLIGYGGAFLILLGFFKVSSQAWKPSSMRFQLSNAVGSGMLIAYSLFIAAYPYVLLNVIWLGVALTGIARNRRRPKKA